MTVEPNRDQQHLPGPSLWPIGFAIGVACVLVGLIISWPVVAVGAAIAAISADLGFAYELGNAIFLISRLPGLIAHAHEERTRQSPMRQIDPKDHTYDGAGQRRLPEGRK